MIAACSIICVLIVPVIVGFADNAYSVQEGENTNFCLAVLSGTVAIDITVRVHIDTICK